MIAETDKILSGQSILYFGPGKWDGMWRNRHHLMSRFSAHNRVMYIEPVPGIRKVFEMIRQDGFTSKQFWKELFQRRIRKVSDNLFIYRSPLYLPKIGRFPLDRLFWGAWKVLFRKALASLGFDRPIVWFSLPTMTNFIGHFDEQLIIYHVVDEYSAYQDLSTESRTRIQDLEKEMLKKADLVIVVSRQLYENKKPYNKNIHLVPNGVDFEAYDRAMASETAAPRDIADLPKPIIGYSGLISKRLDLNLIKHLATTHPEWSIVLIGSVDQRGCASEMRTLIDMNNVHFLGLKDIRQVPFYVKAFDVCLIPYAINEETQNLSPLKLYDFLATGKPVVTTGFPAALEFTDVVLISDCAHTCQHMIERELTDPSQDFFQKRRQIAAANTWDHKTSQISRMIELRLLEKL